MMHGRWVIRMIDSSFQFLCIQLYALQEVLQLFLARKTQLLNNFSKPCLKWASQHQPPGKPLAFYLFYPHAPFDKNQNR